MEITTILNPEIIEKIQAWWYFVMFGLMVAEWPFVTLASAFLASMGIFNIFLVAILGWLWDVIGDVILFCIGKYWLWFFQKKIQSSEKNLDKNSFLKKLDSSLHHNFFMALLFIKFTPYAPMIALPYLGTRNISLTKFALATTIISAPVPILVAIIGFKLHAIKSIFDSINPHYYWPVWIWILILIAIILFFGYKYIKKIQKKLFETIDKYSENTKNPK